MNPPTKNDDVCVGYNQVTGLRSSRTRSPRQGGAGCVLTSHSNSNCNDKNDNLREVGVPSRNTLHGRGMGLKFRIRGTRLVGIWSAWAATPKIKF